MGETHDTTADRLTFWRGWYEGARRYPDAQRLAVYDAIFAFAFDGVEPIEPAGDITAAIVYQTIATIRPTIAISRKRREFGAAGGQSKRQANGKQTASKTQAKGKQNRKSCKQVKEQEQEQEQEQEHIAISSTATREQPPTLDQFLAGAVLAGVPEDFARDFYAGLVAAGWRDAEGLYVANWRRYLKSAWVDEQKKFSAARADASASDELMKGLRRARA